MQQTFNADMNISNLHQDVYKRQGILKAPVDNLGNKQCQHRDKLRADKLRPEWIFLDKLFKLCTNTVFSRCCFTHSTTSCVIVISLSLIHILIWFSQWWTPLLTHGWSELPTGSLFSPWARRIWRLEQMNLASFLLSERRIHLPFRCCYNSGLMRSILRVLNAL